MSDTPDNGEKSSRPSRRWYRLHLSTWLVMLMLAAVLVLIIVPGESSWQAGFVFPSAERFEHGWPLVHMRRTQKSRSKPIVPPGSIPWLQKKNWRLTVDRPVPYYWADEVGFSAGMLACNILIAVLILAIAGAVFECWRRRRSRAYQFSLRELCVVVLLCAGILAWWRMHHVRSQRELRLIQELCPRCKKLPSLAGHEDDPFGVFGFNTEYCGPKWLRKLTGSRPLIDFYAVAHVHFSCAEDLKRSVPELKRWSHLECVSLTSHTVTNKELEPLRELRNVRSLSLDGKKISDGALAHLKGLTNLRELELSDTAVTGSGLTHLGCLTRLESLDLSCTRLHNAGVQHLRRLTGLRNLDVSLTAITSAGMADLGRVRGLRSLRLHSTDVHDDGLARLAALEDLRELHLLDTPVTDAGLVHLQNMSKLESLSLPDQITDAGLVHIERLQNLRFLDVQSTQVTDQGVKRLQRALPDCEVCEPIRRPGLDG